MTTQAWKVWTHDLRSPLQGGKPVWDGTLPYTLPEVKLDRSDRECAAGWNACADLATALRIAGLWPTGWPSRPCRVSTDGEVIARGDKLRAASWTVERWATDAEIREAVAVLSRLFGEHAEAMVDEQMAWRGALARPRWDEAAVEAGLHAALEHRGLDWTIRRYSTAGDVQTAQAAWAARDAQDAWDAQAVWTVQAARAARAAWAAWDAQAAQAARAARAAWTTLDAWDARAAWTTRAARAAWTTQAALTVRYAAYQGWIDQPADLLDVGIRDAYEHGLALALPTGPTELGWAMVEEGR